VVIAAGKLAAFERVESWVMPARDTVAESDALSAQVICLSECATHLIFGGRYATADALCEAIANKVAMLQAADVQAVAAFEQTRAIRAMAGGDLGAAKAGFEAALAASGKAGNQRSTCVIRSNLGFVLAELGDFKGAEESLRAALGAADRMALHDLSTVVTHNLGHVLAYCGNLEEALRLEHQAVEAFQKHGDPRLEGLARTYLAKISILCGDLSAAERESRTAVDLLVATPPLRAGALAVLARALLGQGRSTEALEAAREASALLESLGTIEEGESLVRLVYAEALAADGKEADFVVAITAARDHLLARAAKISDPVWRARFLTGVPDNAQTITLAPPAQAAGG
jgi:tetratricopeptide (TPR) repeat protein